MKICLFDLDDTLVSTRDLQEVREACRENNDPAILTRVTAALNRRADRHIYSLELLKRIRLQFPGLRLGVFTRSPRSYAELVLTWAYPGFPWDILVAFEDVRRTKPEGEGIDLAMDAFDVEDLDQVIMVGDNDVDIKAAYHCGCLVALDKSAWPAKFERDHWNAFGHIPDVIIENPENILDVLSNYRVFLPELERLMDGADLPSGNLRFDKINHFISKAAGGGTTAYPIHVAGRSFSNYPSVKFRHQWHDLTLAIEENKDADTFPDEWIMAIRAFIRKQFAHPFRRTTVIVTVVPHRPGRKPRLEYLLAQLQDSIEAEGIRNCDVVVKPELLAYKDGVKSQHNDHLSRDERFVNVRDHLFVQQKDQVTGQAAYLVIDDVTTTGASLIYAAEYLQAEGATSVTRLSIAKNIGNV